MMVAITSLTASAQYATDVSMRTGSVVGIVVLNGITVASIVRAAVRVGTCATTRPHTPTMQLPAAQKGLSLALPRPSCWCGPGPVRVLLGRPIRVTWEERYRVATSPEQPWPNKSGWRFQVDQANESFDAEGAHNVRNMWLTSKNANKFK